MSTIDCAVVRDLLPLYVEKISSEETRKLVEEHLAECQDCRNLLEDMTTEETPTVKLDVAPLKRLKRKMVRSRIGVAVVVALFVAIFGGGVIGYLTAWEYVPYSPDLLQVEGGGGPYDDGGSRVSICATDGAKQLRTGNSDGAHDTAYVSVWTSFWERHFANDSAQCMGYWSTSAQMSVYYMSLGGEENTLIYGPGTTSGGDTPFLIAQRELGDYLMWAGVSAVILIAGAGIFRKREFVRVWLERIGLIPVSYLIGHLCVKGFSIATYEYQRDFSLIVIVGVVVYVVALLGLHLYRVRNQREIQ